MEPPSTPTTDSSSLAATAVAPPALPLPDMDAVRRLAGEMAAFLSTQYGFELPARRRPGGEMQTPDGDDRDDGAAFRIDSSAAPLYRRVQGAADIEPAVSLLIAAAHTMAEAVDDLCDRHEPHLTDDDTREALDMIARQVNRFVKTADARRRVLRLEDATSVGDLQEAFYRFLAGLLRQNLIDRVLPALAAGMQGRHAPLYRSLAAPVNRFLATLGIYTPTLQPGDRIDFDICRPVASTENRTRDHRLKEVIKEVRRLPYLFDATHPVGEGEVVVWRFDDDR